MPLEMQVQHFMYFTRLCTLLTFWVYTPSLYQNLTFCTKLHHSNKGETSVFTLDSWVPSLRQEEIVSMNAGLRGRGGGGTQTFQWYVENLFDSIVTEELFTNVHEPIETMPYFLLTLLFVSPSSLLWQSVWFYTCNTNDHRYPYLNSIYKWKYLDSM